MVNTWLSIGLVFLLSISTLTGQELQFSASDSSRLHQSDSLKELGDYSGSISILQSLITKFKTNGNRAAYHYTSNEQMVLANKQANYQEVIIISDSIIKSAELNTKDYPTLFAQTYLQRGIAAESLGNIDQAIESFKKGINLKIEWSERPELFAKMYGYLGDNYYYNKDDLFLSEFYYQKEQQILQQLTNPEHEALIYNFYSLANIYRKKCDFEKALTYSKKALNTAQTVEENQRYLEICTYQLGNIYGSKGKPHEALKSYRDYAALLHNYGNQNNSKFIRCYNNMAHVFDEIGQEDSALIYLQKAEGIFKQSSYYEPTDEARYYQRLASIFHTDYRKALTYAHTSKAIYQKALDKSTTKISFIHKVIAEIQLEHGQYDSALFYIQQSLFPNEIISYGSKNKLPNPELSRLENNYGLFYGLVLKAKIIGEQYKLDKRQESLEHLTETYNLVNSAVRLYRKSYIREGSLLYLSKINHSIYIDALNYLSEAPESYYENLSDIALSFIENSRSHSLSELMLEIENRQRMGIPDSILFEENTIKSSIRKLEYELSKANNKTMQEQIESDLYQMHLKQDSFIVSVKHNFPNYFSIKYNDLEASIEQLQQLAKEEDRIIVDYLKGDKELFVLAISADSSLFYKIPHAEQIEENIIQFTSLLRKGIQINTLEADFKKYTKLSYSLYKSLLQPVIQLNSTRNITLIPDGVLSTLPFEALTTELVDSEKVDYKNLPYLVKTHQISFSNSAVLMLKHKDASLVKDETVLLFGTGDNKSDNNTLSDLPGTIKEVEAIADLFKNKQFIGKNATKENFILTAHQYEVIHLAMHNYTDTANKMNSGLLFNGSNRKLFLHELYDLNINARLSVLSACETGTGRYYKGEGVHSIGRSFAYSGSQSLVFSLWKVNDLQTQKIILEFYQNLKKSRTIDGSLANSKRSYIYHADHLTAHPSNWAAFISWGATTAIFPQKSYDPIIIGGLISLVLVSLLLFIYYRNKKSR